MINSIMWQVSSEAIEAKHLELFREVFTRAVDCEGSVNSADMELLRADGASSPTDHEGKRAGSEGKSLAERK